VFAFRAETVGLLQSFCRGKTSRFGSTPLPNHRWPFTREINGMVERFNLLLSGFLRGNTWVSTPREVLRWGATCAQTTRRPMYLPSQHAFQTPTLLLLLGRFWVAGGPRAQSGPRGKEPQEHDELPHGVYTWGASKLKGQTGHGQELRLPPTGMTTVYDIVWP